MSISLNIDQVVKCVKTIVDNNRCIICDKIDGFRERYPCGHTACSDCVATVSSCLLCLSPTSSDFLNYAVRDDPLTLRIKTATTLLKACQDTFNIDVYKRHRISEQLKVEKEVFPECIQAPIKYCNKRKSLNMSKNIKENRRPSFLPGELVSPINDLKMKKSDYVQQWLDNNNKKPTENQTRKPFADKKNPQKPAITQSTPLKKRSDIIMDKVRVNFDNVTQRSANRKRSHIKSSFPVAESKPHINKYLKPVKKGESQSTKIFKPDFNQHNKIDTISLLDKKNDKHESGIELDDETIVIHDTQSFVDKDREAWLAVLEANKNESQDSLPSIRLECNEIVKYTDDVENTVPNTFELEIPKESLKLISQVPFYKKSYLHDPCKLCCKDKEGTFVSQTAGQSKDVSITIESSSFITTIKVSDVIHNNSKGPNHSISIQTDDINKKFIENPDNLKHKQFNEIKSQAVKYAALDSQDLFTAEEENVDRLRLKTNLRESLVESAAPKHIIKEANKLVVVDSETDDELNQSSVIQVTADVHRSSDELDFGVLTELDQTHLQLRTSRIERGRTSASTDSSDKENYDPNRPKKMRLGKKSADKKKNKKKHNLFELHSINTFKE